MVAPASTVRCPNCGSPIQAQVHQLVDVSQDPSLKSRLLSGSLNIIRCPVCSYEGQLSTPVVYHDPSKELLLTYMPVELGIAKDEQEKLLGRLINQSIENLPAEGRKGYLLQPQAVLTIQGLVERILAEDGITKEELEEQRAKLRLFEDLLSAPEDSFEKFVEEHDQELDERFFQLGALSLQTTNNEQARVLATQRLERALELSSYGAQLTQREAELRAAAESLRQAGDDLTRELLLELLIEAPNDDRVQAIVSLARPGLDYSFFQQLTDQMEAAEGEERERLKSLRQRLLDLTDEIDKAQEARIAQTSDLLSSLAQAEDLDAAVAAALPLVDELFLAMLQANIKAAEESQDTELSTRLRELDAKLNSAIRDSLPANLQLAQSVLEAEDEQQARQILDDSIELIDDQVLGALMSTAQRLDESSDSEGAERMRNLHRHALRLSMRAQIQS